MITLSKLRLEDWYAFHLEMRQYTRQNLLKKGKLLTRTYIVYFIFEGDPQSPDFQPRYIGCTGSFYWRMVQHRRKITLQTKVYIQEFATKAEALQYEKRCIKAWQPALNIKYNTWWQYDLIG